MKLKEYLRAKYGDSGGLGLPDDEATALGVPLPLHGGWYQSHGAMEITAEQARAIVASLLRARTRTKGERKREIAQSGIDALCAEYGPMFDVEEMVEHEFANHTVAVTRSELRREKRRAKRAAKAAAKVKSSLPRAPRIEPPPSAANSANSDAFLSSYEWRRVRMMVLKRDGRKCACCGATPESGAVMNVDHIKPRRFFPELALDPSNLQVLCGDCNHGKGNWDMTDWRQAAMT